MVTGDGLRVPGARANGAAGPQGERHGMARVIEPLLFGSIPCKRNENGGRGRNRTADTGIFKTLFYVFIRFRTVSHSRRLTLIIARK